MTVKKFKLKNETEFVCRKCMTFLDAKDLSFGKCPKCKTDEYVYNNDLKKQN